MRQAMHVLAKSSLVWLGLFVALQGQTLRGQGQPGPGPAAPPVKGTVNSITAGAGLAATPFNPITISGTIKIDPAFSNSFTAMQTATASVDNSAAGVITGINTNSTAGAGAYGVYGASLGSLSNAYGVVGSGTTAGVGGTSTNIGVLGISGGSGYGVWGQGTYGVYGAGTTYGVYSQGDAYVLGGLTVTNWLNSPVGRAVGQTEIVRGDINDMDGMDVHGAIQHLDKERQGQTHSVRRGVPAGVPFQ